MVSGKEFLCITNCRRFNKGVVISEKKRSVMRKIGWFNIQPVTLRLMGGSATKFCTIVSRIHDH